MDPKIVWLNHQIQFVILLYFVRDILGEVARFDYMVDCSACHSVPIQNIKSYSCKVRCALENDQGANLTSIYDILARVLNEQQVLKAEREDDKKKMDALQKKINLLNTGVTFTVGLIEEKSFDVNDAVIFDRVVNNIGNAYSTTTGKFVAPYNGTYEFFGNLMNKNEGTVSVDLQHNAEVISSTHAGWEHGQVGVVTGIINLTEMDEVYLRSRFGPPRTYHVWSTFSGHLLRIHD